MKNHDWAATGPGLDGAGGAAAAVATVAADGGSGGSWLGRSSRQRPGSRVDTTEAAAHLVSGLLLAPWGQISPSVYESARLVSLAPWLAGHGARIRYLLATQRADGAWGGPDGYDLVPTLSAAEALLRVAGTGLVPAEIGLAPLARALDRAFGILPGLLRATGAGAVPDTPAVEIIVPALVGALNAELGRLREVALIDGWRPPAGLPVPDALPDTTLTAIRSRLRAGRGVSEKLLHSLEVVADESHLAQVHPVGPGTVGASPAATAAWLVARDRGGAARTAVGYLEESTRPHGGPVPSVLPITGFERSWVVGTLLRCGVAVTLPSGLLRSMAGSVDEAGVVGGAGLPHDADTTSATLYALRLAGVQSRQGVLARYQAGNHFATWPDERTPSPTTNAHVLDAVGILGAAAGFGAEAEATIARIEQWLVEQQEPDGSWRDKWHSSPYYATACCVLALHQYGSASASARSVAGGTAGVPGAIGRARAWILGTQRADGSWGRWGGTAEETAYAVQVLVQLGGPGTAQAVARGAVHLLAGWESEQYPPLWHDKDLYVPTAVVRAAILGAVRLIDHDPEISALVRAV